MAKPPSRRSSTGEIAQFLHKSKTITQFVQRQPRLMFAVDATASRQPTWDTACQIQGEMFRATDQVATLAVQLCYYRGFNEFSASRWLNDSAATGPTDAPGVLRGRTHPDRSPTATRPG